MAEPSYLNCNEVICPAGFGSSRDGNSVICLGGMGPAFVYAALNVGRKSQDRDCLLYTSDAADE